MGVPYSIFYCNLYGNVHLSGKNSTGSHDTPSDVREKTLNLTPGFSFSHHGKKLSCNLAFWQTARESRFMPFPGILRQSEHISFRIRTLGFMFPCPFTSASNVKIKTVEKLIKSVGWQWVASMKQSILWSSSWIHIYAHTKEKFFTRTTSQNMTTYYFYFVLLKGQESASFM